jgi:hypothetical protein
MPTGGVGENGYTPSLSMPQVRAHVDLAEPQSPALSMARGTGSIGLRPLLATA